MEDPIPSPPTNKWYGRLALIFAFLFAMLWSLDSSFFWVLSGLSLSFAVLAFFSSGIRFDFLNRSQTYQDHREHYEPQTSASPTAAEPAVIVKRMVRFVIIGAVSLFLFLFIVGIFAGDDDDTAQQETTSEIESEPEQNDEALAWNDKGNVALNGSNYDSALYYYNKSLDADPEYQYALYNKGLVFSLRKEYRKSIAVARNCVRIHPDYNPAWWLLGYNLNNLNNSDSAILCLETAYANGYDETDFLELMAEIYFKRNERAKATEFYIKVIASDSSRTDALRKLAELDPEHGDFYRRKASEFEKSTR